VSKLGPAEGRRLGKALIGGFNNAETEGIIDKIERIRILVSLAL
jgi:hypothetical protein